MVTKAEIKASISDGNLNPKMFKRFFDDLKIKAYSYDYIIQRDLVNYYETRLSLNPLTSKIMDDVFSPDSDRVIEISISHQFVVPGEKERYKRSSVFNKFMTHEELTENMKYFKYNILVFVDDEIFTGYKAKAYRLNLYFLTKDLHDIRKRIDPDTKVDEIAKNVTVLFLPNAVIGSIDNLEPRMFNGNNIEAYNFPDYVKDKFSKAGKYFGFWINKTNGSQYMIPYIEYNPDYKYFTLPDNPPTNISNYSLMVVGMSVIKDYKDIPGGTEWIQFASERMPLPKDNIMILRERNGSYVPINGNVSLTEYYPNIYRINNPNQWNLRIYALYEDSSQNNHIDYDEEITPYLQRIDILDQYNTDKVPEILKEYKPVQWNYSIQDFIEKNPYKNLDLSNQWDSFLYKMETISSMLKKWYLFYEEYERRTYGFLTGWYHNIANYKNMPDKIRLNTAQDIDNRDLYYEFDEPQYLFTYVNSTEFGSANSYCFFVDGVYTIPTKIIVYRGYQYVYFPTRIIKDTTVIEVERFDGVVINRDILIPEEGVTLKFSDLANVPTIANCLFFVNPEDGSYLNHNELETTIIDPEIGEVVVDFRTSVYKITPSMSIKIKANDENLINKYVRLCCNNQTFQFIERESGIDFTRGRDDEIDLNRMNYVTNINESILPRLRIFTEQGRMIPKRDYYVNKHNSYDDPPKFNIPMKASDDERFCVAYIGYDERLIYHKDNIPSNGLISLEGRMQRPFSFAYHDIYLDGFRLTKYDVDIISPNTIIIKAIKK